MVNFRYTDFDTNIKRVLSKRYSELFGIFVSVLNRSAYKRGSMPCKLEPQHFTNAKVGQEWVRQNKVVKRNNREKTKKNLCSVGVCFVAIVRKKYASSGIRR